MRRVLSMFSGFALSVSLCLCFCLVPAAAQDKPPESSTKIKKVLLYNKIGGWVHVDGSQVVRETMVKLAAAKGFELTQSNDASFLTPENLRQFQVIVWNNNTSGGASVPDPAARRAVFDYLNQGGGWFLIHGASWGLDSWPDLLNALGTQFSHHAGFGIGEVALDREARAHRELKWMVDGMPDTLHFTEEWDSYRNNVRGKPGVIMIATVRNKSGSADLEPFLDESGEWPSAWAREVGQGRLIFNTLGHGHSGLMGQNDSLLPRMYWESLRYAAGDFQNGCPDPADPRFDPAARVNNDAMCSTVGLRAVPARPGLVVRKGGLGFRLDQAFAGPLTIRVRNIRGEKVWERTVPSGIGEITLDDAIAPGVYHFEVAGSASSFQRRMALP